MGYQIDLAGTPELSESGGTITVKYSATNSGDSESGGTWDQALVTTADGSPVYDTSAQVHSLQPGDSYDKHIEQMQAVDAGTYNVNLVLDSQGASNQAWSGQVTVG